MYWFIKIFYGVSNATLVTLTLLVVLAQFSYSAITAGRIAVPEQRIEKLTMLSLAELGEVRVSHES